MSSVIRREIPCAYLVCLSISRSPRTDTQKVWTCWQPAPSARRAIARLFGPQSALSRSYALHPNVGVWLPSYIERLALAPLESVADTMRARVGVRSSLRRSFKGKLGWKPAIILSRKDWHCVQDRAVVWWPRPGTEVRLDPAPPASSPVRGFGGDGGNRRRQPNGGSREIDRHPIVAPVSGFTARRPCP